MHGHVSNIFVFFMHGHVSNILLISFDKTYKFNYEIQEDHQARKSHQMYIEGCNSTFAVQMPLLYGIGGVILPQMFIHEGISRNN